MKRFAINITSFLVLILVLAIILDLGISYSLQQQIDDRRYAPNIDIFHNKIDADVLIMGSSRACVSYSPQILDSILHIKSYNLGMHGRSFYMHGDRYNLYKHYYPKPKVIIQNIDFYSTLGLWGGGRIY